MERNEKMFLRAEEVAELMEVSVPYAYKLIRRMNRELEKNSWQKFLLGINYKNAVP